MITSTGNPQIKQIIQLQKKSKTRWQQRVFVVEGPKMVFEAPREWVQKVYVAEGYLRKLKQQETERHGEDDTASGDLGGYAHEIVSDAVFQSISDTRTPQGILCLVQMPEYTLEQLLAGTTAANTGEEEGHGREIAGNRKLPQEEPSAPHLLILESIQDPGNLGTMLRTGEGAGISGIIMNRTTVDIFSPKVVRATMGSLYRVPFYIAEDLGQTIGELKRHGVSVYAAHLKGEKSYDKPDYTEGTAFLVGNEGNGLTEETAKLADEYIRIPMEGQVESLNAAIAATLLMYEAYRQRRG